MTSKTTKHPFDFYGGMMLLWLKAHRTMSPQELEWFAMGASEYVPNHARYMEDVLNGIACLVGKDGEDGPGAGSFQSHRDVPQLLFAVANQMSVLAGMAEMASDASAILREQAKA